MSTKKSPATTSKGNGKATRVAAVQTSPCHDLEGRFDSIATAAYYMAEARQFAPGQELDDWLAAEREFAGR